MSRLHVDSRGTGARTAVVLHGFLGSGRNLMSLARAWTERDPGLRVLLPDLTGHGRSPPLSAEPTLGELAADVAELLAEVGPARLVGHSLGGRVALCVADRAPLLARDLTLLDIAPGPIPAAGPGLVLTALLGAPGRAPSRQAMGQALADAGAPADLIPWLLMNLERDTDGVRWRVDRQALARLHERTAGVDLWPLLERADAPIRVHTCIRGGRSPFVSDADGARLRSLGARVATIEGAGHFLHADALPELVPLLAP